MDNIQIEQLLKGFVYEFSLSRWFNPKTEAYITDEALLTMMSGRQCKFPITQSGIFIGVITPISHHADGSRIIRCKYCARYNITCDGSINADLRCNDYAYDDSENYEG